jgi:hypothetical protein
LWGAGAQGFPFEETGCSGGDGEGKDCSGDVGERIWDLGDDKRVELSVLLVAAVRGIVSR